jgi:hypothetical protein
MVAVEEISVGGMVGVARSPAMGISGACCEVGVVVGTAPPAKLQADSVINRITSVGMSERMIFDCMMFSSQLVDSDVQEMMNNLLTF